MSKRHTILLTWDIFPQYLERLRKNFEVVRAPMGADILDPRQIEGILCLLNDRIDPPTLLFYPNLKAISVCAVGYNNIDLVTAHQRGIVVTNTPGVLTNATADLTWALILAVTRRIGEAERFLRAGHFTGWGIDLFRGMELCGKTLGLIGLGRIGLEVAKRAIPFGLLPIYYDKIRILKEQEHRWGISYSPLDRLFATSDIITLHVPLLAETHHLINAEAFQKMKRGVYLINTSRGPVVDEKALVEALKSGIVSGVGLDVYENEPAIEPALLEMEKVVLLPHIGSATIETRNRMAELAVSNLEKVLLNQGCENIV